jgi:lysophospholipase L1-like esterase
MNMEIHTGARRIVDPISFREKTSLFIFRLNELIMERCSEMAVPVVDLFKGLVRRDDLDLLNPEFAIGDNAHLNIDGQKKVAEVLIAEYFNEAAEFDLVVCLGDSHTQGFPVRNDISRNGSIISAEMDSPHQFPYWLWMKTNGTFINRGIAGNTFYGMRNRFNEEVVTHYPDHCIIQGGTNDALLGVPFEESVGDLFSIIDKCIGNRITPVVCTVIPLGF